MYKGLVIQAGIHCLQWLRVCVNWVWWWLNNGAYFLDCSSIQMGKIFLGQLFWVLNFSLHKYSLRFGLMLTLKIALYVQQWKTLFVCFDISLITVHLWLNSFNKKHSTRSAACIDRLYKCPLGVCKNFNLYGLQIAWSVVAWRVPD